MTRHRRQLHGSVIAGALVTALVCGVSVPVAAQRTAAAVPTAAARQEFELGVAAMRDERYDEALTHFEHSYALVPRTVTIMNLGSAQLRAGRFVAAIESYRRFLADATPAERARYESDVNRQLATAQAAVGNVALRIDGMQAGDRLVLDGDALPSAALDVTLPLDPGGHEIVVERGRERVGQATFVVRRGETTTAALSLARAEGTTAESTASSPAETERLAWTAAGTTPRQETRPESGRGAREDDTASTGGLLASPWFWVVAGVLVAGATVAIVLVASGSDDPTATNVGSPMLVF